MREERERERDNLNRSSTLLKSLLASGVAVSREVRGLMEEMETEWHQCERDIRDMEEFVHKQTPVKAIGLQENMEVSYELSVCPTIIITNYSVQMYQHGIHVHVQLLQLFYSWNYICVCPFLFYNNYYKLQCTNVLT